MKQRQTLVDEEQEGNTRHFPDVSREAGPTSFSCERGKTTGGGYNSHTALEQTRGLEINCRCSPPRTPTLGTVKTINPL